MEESILQKQKTNSCAHPGIAVNHCNRCNVTLCEKCKWMECECEYEERTKYPSCDEVGCATCKDPYGDCVCVGAKHSK